MADVAVAACDAVLPTSEKRLSSVAGCAHRDVPHQPLPVTVGPRSPRKLRHADTGSTRRLMENPQEAAVAAAFPHRHFTTPPPAGLPGAAPALPSSAAPPAAAAPPGAGQAGGSGGARRGRSCLSLPPGRREPGTSAGAYWSRLAAGRAGRLGPRPAPAVGSKGGQRRSCTASAAAAATEPPLRPEQPRWQRAQRRPTGRTVHQSEQRFSPAVRGSPAQEFAGGRSPDSASWG